MLYNIEAEKMVLISMIQEHEIIDDVVSQLRVDDLYNKDHQKLYSTILKLHDDNKVFDLLILEQYGCSKKMLQDMVNDVPRFKGLYKYDYVEYLKIVLELSLKRRIIVAAKEIQHMACKNELCTDLSTFKADCMEKLDVKIFESPYTNGKIGIQEIENVLNIIDDRCSKDTNIDFDKYGYRWLDMATAGTHKGEVTILAARPGTGKTAFSLNIALNKILSGEHVRIFSLEMTKESLLERMLVNVSSVDGLKLRAGQIGPEDFQKLEKAQKLIASKNLYIDNTHSFEEIRGICRRAKNKNQLDYLIIDYLQLIETENMQNSTNDKLEYLSRRIKLMACEMDIPILLLSQLNRATESRNDRTPQMSDLRGSGAIEQDADNIFFLHCMQNNDICEAPFEDDKTADVILTIAKQRNGIADKNNIMKFIKVHQRFAEPEYKYQGGF